MIRMVKELKICKYEIIRLTAVESNFESDKKKNICNNNIQASMGMMTFIMECWKLCIRLARLMDWCLISRTRLVYRIVFSIFIIIIFPTIF